MEGFHDFIEERGATVSPTCSRDLGKRKKDFLFYVIFGLSLILICLVANVGLFLTVRGPLEMAVKEQTNGCSGLDEDGEVQKVAIFFYFSGLFNLVAIIVATQRFNSGMEWALYHLNHGRIFDFEPPTRINGFYIRNTVIHILFLLMLLMLILLGIFTSIVATPHYIWHFSVASCWFSLGCLMSSLQFVHELENLEPQSEEQILREHVKNLGNV